MLQVIVSKMPSSLMTHLGEVNLTSTLTSTNLPPVIQLQVRAYDLGVPHLHAETVVDIYTQEVMARSIHFIMPKRIDEEETKRIESLLTLLTGAPTTINTIQPYSEDGSAPLTMGFTEKMSDDPSSPDKYENLSLFMSNVVLLI